MSEIMRAKCIKYRGLTIPSCIDRLYNSRWNVGLCSLWVILLIISSAYADEVYEFDGGFEGWKVFPSQLGRTTESGWVHVDYERDRIVRNRPVRNRATYYWKLTRDFDLRELSHPSFELKYHFKGQGYDYFRILIGDQGAQKLDDFSILHEVREATEGPDEVTINLDAYTGQRVRIQLVLRKPNDVLEHRPGVHIHRVAITTPSRAFNLEDRSDELRFTSFNVQAFGLSKISNPEVFTTLTQIMTRFDCVMIQEVRDASETAMADVLSELNAMSAVPYALYLSNRLGRGSSKEQIAFVYRTDKLSFVESGTIPDPDDLFERPPVWVRFEHVESEERVWVLGAHLEPNYVASEIVALYEVFAQYQRETPVSESAIIMGDLKAGCRFLTEDEIALSSLFNSSSLTLLISDEVDTTTTPSFCPYDRIFVGGPWVQRVEESGVYRFDQVLGLTSQQTRAISDHYPVWVRFRVSDIE